MPINEGQDTNEEWDLLEQAAKLFQQRKYDEADEIFQKILKINPENAHSLHGIAAIAVEKKDYDKARTFCKKALALENNIADFFYTYGLIDEAQKRLEDALINFQMTIKLKPTHIPALIKLGDICRNQGAIYRKTDMLNAALNFYTQALALRADIDTYQSMSYIYSLLGQRNQAILVNEACLRRYPNSPVALVNLAFLYDLSEEYTKALSLFERAIEIEPHMGEHYANKAGVLKNLGRTDEAIEIYKQAIKISPDKPNIYHSLLLTMVYSATTSPAELYQNSKEFGKNIADPLFEEKKFSNDRNPNRKLRIGYVSPDFRDHAVKYFLAPIYFADKENFEVFAYSKNTKDDDITQYIKGFVDHWRDIQYLKPEKAAEQILADKIDILIDLAGHTAHNGLLIFAHKPAPIQVTWLGHPATTGMKAMDYRISDAFAEPPGMTENYNTETLWRLPHIFCAFTPPKNGPEPIDHPPFEDNGYITFGCFNNFTKVTDPVLKVWSRILEEVPNSHLLLEIPGLNNDKVREAVEKRFADHGIPLDRLDLRVRSKANQYVLYNEIDLALDPFPCNGGTTSMDTLWMGVPFITLAGRHFGARMGVTILNNAGLAELVTETEASYVSLAIELANNPTKLKGLRGNLRNRVMCSPLMNEKAFAMEMENAFREMWKIWLSKQ